MALVSGCIGNGGTDKDDNQAPNAKLDVNRNTGWNGETFTFDASNSDDPDGNIARYRYDFGDGTTHEGTRESDDEISHAYAQGGEYTVTLTVTDDGQDRSGALTDTDELDIAVNERRPVAQQAIYAAPTGNTSIARFVDEFEAFDGADRFEVDLTANSTLLVGSTELNIRVKDPSGDILDEESMTINSQESESVSLGGMLQEQGTHIIEVEAESGGALVTGESRVYYDTNFLDRDDDQDE